VRALTNFCDNVTHVEPGWMEYEYSTKELLFKNYDVPKPRKTIANIENIIKNTLITSVKDRLMSQRPIGCLLSGGLDSSLITSILCQLLGPKNVRTYSIGMEGSEDLKQAKNVANFFIN
jgi:asparagine synthase (glutamine-hydrolysing)